MDNTAGEYAPISFQSPFVYINKRAPFGYTHIAQLILLVAVMVIHPDSIRHIPAYHQNRFFRCERPVSPRCENNKYIIFFYPCPYQFLQQYRQEYITSCHPGGVVNQQANPFPELY